MAFHVGQKVVCVDAQQRTYPHNLQFNKVYTVSAIIPTPRLPDGVDLCEYSSPSPWGFQARRFRPIVSKSTETGMAILREIIDRESIEDRKSVRAPATSRRLPCHQSPLT